nr:unnamed protein product [Callosobruchus chinensis]
MRIHSLVLATLM